MVAHMCVFARYVQITTSYLKPWQSDVSLWLLIKCKVWGACQLVATTVLSSVTYNGVSAELSDSPPVRCVAGRRSCRIPVDSLLSAGPAGRQETWLPAEQHASCTDRPPFHRPVSLCVFLWAASLFCHTLNYPTVYTSTTETISRYIDDEWTAKYFHNRLCQFYCKKNILWFQLHNLWRFGVFSF